MSKVGINAESTLSRSHEIKEFIENHQSLFWYSPAPKSETVSDELLIEHILNYGSMDDVRELLKIMHINEAAKIFFKSINKSERRKNNYHKIILNYFTLFFKKYAS